MNREWMYRRFTSDGYISPEFQRGLESFIQFACDQPAYMDGNKIRCPCRKCKNLAYREVDTVRLHISSKGFMFNYHVWSAQGERQVMRERPNLAGSSSSAAGTSQYHQMVLDVAAGSSFNMDNQAPMDADIEEPPNPEAQKFYDMLRAADNELWPGCSKHSQLSLVARMINLKSENNISEKCFDGIAELMKEIVPDDNLLPDNFYKTKRLLRGMGLPVLKIDCCYHNCMLYWKHDIELDQCRICGYPRYDMRNKKRVAKKRMYYFPLTPRLQRLYASNATAAHMHWHASSVDDGVMRHPADSPAWKHLDNTFPDFGAETRNVRLGLSTDGFQPFGQTGKQYSSWPVVLTPYNLPPWMCMKEQYMFLTVLVPGPQNPKEKLDVFLQPLIEELCELWSVGVTTYDISKKQNFVMRAALMWTISDFPAFSMLSGWSTAGRLACPHCRESTDAFTLPCSGKQSWFDNHRKYLPPDHVFRRNKRGFLKNKVVMDAPPEMKNGVEILDEIERLGLRKVTEPNNNASISKASGCGWKKRSIFWDLPYWSTLLIRHNLDVMHIEKNVFDNMDPGGYAWKFVSEEFKMTYWNEFLKGFRWSPPLTDAKVYELWLARAAVRYSDHVSQVKSNRYTTGRPLYMPEEVWKKWCAYWVTDAAKAVSDRAKKNRLSEPDGPGSGVAKHRGGSRSAVAYSYQMARDQGVSIKDTIFPTFKKLHYSERDNTYTSGKAKRIAEEVEVELEDLTQDLPDGVSPTPAETSSIFVAAAQHPVKNRVFGVGSLFSVPSVQSRWEGGGDEAPSMQCDSRLRAELDAVRSKFEAAEKAREDELQGVRSQLEAAEKAREDELQGVRSQLEASEKAREDMERRQDLLKELYQEQQQEQRELREMCATQQRVMEQILRERNTPPDM